MDRADWASVEKAIDQYINGLGGPQEADQINDQYAAWAARWIQ